MKKKSVIIGLPIVPYNQSKHADVSQYLTYVQKLLVDIYKPEVLITYYFCKIYENHLKHYCVVPIHTPTTEGHRKFRGGVRS